MFDSYRNITEKRAQMKQLRKHFCFHYLKGVLYVFGGLSDYQSWNTCEKYNFKEDTWTDIAEITESRIGGSCCSTKNRYIFVFGSEEHFYPDISHVSWYDTD